MIAKWIEEHFGHDEKFFFDCGSGYMNIDICQDSSNYTVQMGTFYVCMFCLNNVGFKQNKGRTGCCVEKTLPGLLQEEQLGACHCRESEKWWWLVQDGPRV